MQSLNKQRIAIIIASAVGMVGTFLPWVTIPMIGSITGTEGDGWVTLVLYAITLGVMFAGNRSLPAKGGLLWGGLAPAIIASLIGLWKIIDLKAAVSDNPFGNMIDIGVGLYVVALAGVVAVILAFVVKDNKTDGY